MTGQVMFDGVDLPEQIPDNQIFVTDLHVRASSFHVSICNNIQSAKTSLFQIAKDLYHMRDEKLYHQLGFDDFKDYCENKLHFSYSLACKYAHVGRFICSAVVPDSLDDNYITDLGINKLYELSRLLPDELNLLFDDCNVSDLSCSDVKKEIKNVKAFKKARDCSGFSGDLSEFKHVVLDTVEASSADALAQSEEGSEDSELDEVDLAVQTMVRLLLNFQGALQQLHNFYDVHEKDFSVSLQLSLAPYLNRINFCVRDDLITLQRYLDSDPDLGGD